MYINAYGDNNNNPNKGKACTEKTDPRNMGTYNYSGMYYKDGLASFSGLNHWLWDIIPYERNGNVSRDDLSGEGEKFNKNKRRYDANNDAKQARNTFEGEWKGIRNE